MTIPAIDLTNDGGVVKTIIKPGSGNKTPQNGDKIFVNYVGKLFETDEEFVSSTNGGLNGFFLGKNEVIKGMEIGIASMKLGEEAEFVIQPDYGFGAESSNVPSNSVLKYEIELLSFQGEDISPDLDGTILKSTVVEGAKYDFPTEYATVKVHAVGSYKERIFFDKNVEFELGEGLLFDLPEGVDRALRRISKGEKCTIKLKGSRFTYGTNPPPQFDLPPNAELDFVLFLTDIEKTKQFWEMTEEEKLEKSLDFKNKGTTFFQEGKYKLALNRYTAIENLLNPSSATDNESKQKVDELLIACYMNCALVHMKLRETAKSLSYCEKVLEKYPNHLKALYRKAQIMEQRKEYDEAVELYKQVISIEPDNKAAAKQIIFCKQQSTLVLSKEKKLYAGIFDRIAMETPSTSEKS